MRCDIFTLKHGDLLGTYYYLEDRVGFGALHPDLGAGTATGHEVRHDLRQLHGKSLQTPFCYLELE